MSSDGFEIRKIKFACLVNHLENKNVFDENFGVAESFNISSVDCGEIVKQETHSFYSDLRTRLLCSPVYNVTSVQCEVLNNPNCTMKKINDGTDATCFSADISTMFLVVKSSGHEESLTTFNRSREDCGKLSICSDCIIDKLAALNYEETRFHATAVNLTVIEYQIWKYFSISLRVKELVQQGRDLENISRRDCEEEKKCFKDSKICE